MSQSVYKKIGEYRFYSQDEYTEGLNDLKKIKTLMGKGSLTNPKLASKLYQQLLSYPDMFESLIGEEFIGKLLHCSNGYPERLDKFFSSLFLDYKSQMSSSASVRERPYKELSVREEVSRRQETARRSQAEAYKWQENILKNQAVTKSITVRKSVNKRKPAKSDSKKENRKKEIVIFLAGVLTCFVVYTAWDSLSYKISTDRSMRKLEALAAQILEPVDGYVPAGQESIDAGEASTERADIRQGNADDSGVVNEDDEIEGVLTSVKEPEEVKPLEILNQYSALYEVNQDLAGWIKIDGTVVNYPVMQTKEDEEYYLYRDFDKETDKTGIPFMDAECDIVETTSNFLIHAHNMKNGTMFATLLKYKQEDFYKEHSIIHFDTIYEAADYEIVSVFLSRVAYQHEEVFKYYNFINAETKEEYDTFIKEIKKLSYYDTGITPEYGEQLITLSTCDRSIEDGRLVVVARKVPASN